MTYDGSLLEFRILEDVALQEESAHRIVAKGFLYDSLWPSGQRSFATLSVYASSYFGPHPCMSTLSTNIICLYVRPST